MKKHLNITLLILTSIVVHITTSCSHQPDNYLASDIRIYKNSEVWELAKAVEKENSELITSITKSKPDLLKFQEPIYGQTLLEWAVYTNKYASCEALINAGANPNTQSFNGTSAFIHAADMNSTSDYLTLLLENGADVNAVALPSHGFDKTQQLKTPLIAACRSNLENVKILVQNGADINYCNDQFQSPLHEACSFDQIEIIHYLLIDKNADFEKPLYFNIDGDSLYITNLLRNMTFKLNSPEYKIKLKVIDFLKERGMDYWQTPIPKHLKEQLDSAYLEVY